MATKTKHCHLKDLQSNTVYCYFVDSVVQFDNSQIEKCQHCPFFGEFVDLITGVTCIYQDEYTSMEQVTYQNSQQAQADLSPKLNNVEDSHEYRVVL